MVERTLGESFLKPETAAALREFVLPWTSRWRPRWPGTISNWSGKTQ
jgi:hypothetical protein